MRHYLKLLLLALIIMLSGCKGNNKKQQQQQQRPQPKAKDTTEIVAEDTEESYDIPEPPEGSHVKLIVEMNDTIDVIVSDSNKQYLAKCYEIPYIKWWYEYEKRKEAPPLSVPKDLTKLSYEDLVILRNEIFARNGYLFYNAYLRDYFDATGWYKPIWPWSDKDTFAVCLSPGEYQEVVRIMQEEEKKRREKEFVEINGLKFYNTDLIVNKRQYGSLPQGVMQDLAKQNFSMVSQGYKLPFYIYEDNVYSSYPHYITTDLMLYVLHKYWSYLMPEIEKSKMSKDLSEILVDLSTELEKLTPGKYSDAIYWARTFVAIAATAQGNTSLLVPEKFKDLYLEEKQKIETASGKPSFIPNDLLSYKELKPVGNYANNDTLRRYFKAFKWLSINGINIDDDLQLRGFLTMAYAIKNNSLLFLNFIDYVTSYEKIAGPEDNLSMYNLLDLVNTSDLDKLLSDENLAQIRQKLKNNHKERIKTVVGKSFKSVMPDITRLYFFSSTYSIGGYIFSKLVHVDYGHPVGTYTDSSKRPFPRSLDIPAVFGNKTAENIILNEYKDAQKWPEYIPRLRKLQQEFSKFHNWDKNYGYKALQTALAASAQQDNYPDFMKSDAYNRKELNTTLASWTHIKHDLTLYQEKPSAVECGSGGDGPPPPTYFCYVEPNVAFWKTYLELVDWLKDFTDDVPQKYGQILRDIENLAKDLLEISEKELNNQYTDTDYLEYIGGWIERMILDLMGTDIWPDRERTMAIVASVYGRWKDGKTTYLDVAIGNADNIYVLVPINGAYYITRGAVFSFYEFKGDIMTDDEWRQMLQSNHAPQRPEWIRPLIHKTK